MPSLVPILIVGVLGKVSVIVYEDGSGDNDCDDDNDTAAGPALGPFFEK